MQAKLDLHVQQHKEHALREQSEVMLRQLAERVCRFCEGVVQGHTNAEQLTQYLAARLGECRALTDTLTQERTKQLSLEASMKYTQRFSSIVYEQLAQRGKGTTSYEDHIRILGKLVRGTASVRKLTPEQIVERAALDAEADREWDKQQAAYLLREESEFADCTQVVQWANDNNVRLDRRTFWRWLKDQTPGWLQGFRAADGSMLVRGRAVVTDGVLVWIERGEWDSEGKVFKPDGRVFLGHFDNWYKDPRFKVRAGAKHRARVRKENQIATLVKLTPEQLLARLLTAK